jgi:sugar lactone lactonase YvrE
MIIGIMMFPMIIRTIILTLASATRISAMVLVTVGAPLADLRGAALRAGDIFVADQSALGGQGAVIRIDPANGTQKSIAAGSLLTHPAGIAVDRGGRIFVASSAKAASLANADLVVADPCAKMIIRIYHCTGAQKAVSWGGKFAFPQNVRVATYGSIVVADRDALGGARAIIRLDAKTGAQTVVSSGKNMFNPTDLALDTEGKLLIADFNSFACRPGGYTGAGAILRLDGSAGAASRADARQASQSLVSYHHLFQNKGPYGIATEGDGKILVTATTGDASPAGAPPRTPTSSYSYGAIGQIIRIDPATGAQNSLSSAVSWPRPSASPSCGVRDRRSCAKKNCTPCSDGRKGRSSITTSPLCNRSRRP